MDAKYFPELTADTRRALRTAGITRQLLCDWRNGRRLPTLPQAMLYANAAGLEPNAFIADVAHARATRRQRRVWQVICAAA